jgi:CubicO group peptidase (beta-lactamase class C family)
MPVLIAVVRSVAPVGLSLLLCAAGVHAQANGFEKRLDEYLRGQGQSSFSGVVLVSRRGQTMFERGYGFADADLAVPNTPSQLYGIGSLTKPVTAAAAMRLVERGRLRLDASICDFLRECPAAWRPVTLEHLLTHTSGVPDLFAVLPAARVGSPLTSRTSTTAPRSSC